MKFPSKNKINQILLAMMWLLAGSGMIVLLVAAVRAKDKRKCKGIEITIHGVSNNFFIDKDDVRNTVSSYAGDQLIGLETSAFNLVAMEAELKREVWIRNADLYFDNNSVLQANVAEREPVARVFNTNGGSFYVDDEMMMLPLSHKMSARLPVFTGFPTDTKVLLKKDSLLLRNVRDLSLKIQADSFLMAMIEQVDITSRRNFEMIPKIGDQVILFGTVDGADAKFEKLKLFYKKVMQQCGWKKYSQIDLQYTGQVVGKYRGKDDVSADSLRTVEIMREIAAHAARAAGDSLRAFLQDNERNTTDISIIQQSMERDEEPASFMYPIDDQDEKLPPAVVTAATIDARSAKNPQVDKKKIPVTRKTAPIKKAVVAKAVMTTNKPAPSTTVIKSQITMPPKNDY